MPKLSFRDSLRGYVPPWLSDRPGKSVGFRFLYAMVSLLDAGAQFAFEGLQARFPGQGTPTALQYIGRDRGIARGPNESDAAYAARLVAWRRSWRMAGNAISLLDNLASYFAPNPPLIRVVTNGGVWTTRAPDGTVTFYRAVPSNWNWDNRPDLWSRIWPIVYANGGVPFSDGGAWGDARRWNDGGTIGTSLRPGDVGALLEIASTWKSASTVCPCIIAAFDPQSFNPLSAPGSPGMPDGTWGTWHKVVNGVAVHTRLQTARYIEVS